MFTNIKTAAFAIALTTGLFGANSAQAQYRCDYQYKHIDRLAFILEKQTQLMHKQVHLFFRNTPSYKHLDSDVYEMEKLARHIHEVAHNRGSIKHLRHDVEKLDKLFHHIEDLAYSMVKTRRLGWASYVTFRASLSRIGRTLHYLRDDLRHLDFHSHDRGHYGFPY